MSERPPPPGLKAVLSFIVIISLLPLLRACSLPEEDDPTRAVNVVTSLLNLYFARTAWHGNARSFTVLILIQGGLGLIGGYQALVSRTPASILGTLLSFVIAWALVTVRNRLRSCSVAGRR